MTKIITLHLFESGKEILCNFDKVFDVIPFGMANSTENYSRVFYDIILRNGKRNVNEVYIDVQETLDQIRSLLIN